MLAGQVIRRLAPTFRALTPAVRTPLQQSVFASSSISGGALQSQSRGGINLLMIQCQQSRNISINRVRKYRKVENKASKRFVCEDDPEDEIPIEIYANDIDTTLTPEQKIYVESLKRKMNGGERSPRSLYRQVAMPGELETNEDMDKVRAKTVYFCNYSLSIKYYMSLCMKNV